MKIETIDRLLDSELEDDIRLGLEYLKYAKPKEIYKIIKSQEKHIERYSYYARGFKGTLNISIDSKYVVRRTLVLFWHDTFVMYTRDKTMIPKLRQWKYEQEFLTPKIKQK